MIRCAITVGVGVTFKRVGDTVVIGVRINIIRRTISIGVDQVQFFAIQTEVHVIKRQGIRRKIVLLVVKTEPQFVIHTSNKRQVSVLLADNIAVGWHGHEGIIKQQG